MKINLKSIFFYIMLLASIFQFAIIPLENIYSLGSIIFFVPILLFFIFKGEYKNIMSIFIYLLYIALITIVKNVGMGIGGSFILIILFILYMDNYSIKEKTYYIIYYAFIVLEVWSLLLSFNFKHKIFYNEIIWFNPNTIGLITMMSIIVINTLGNKIQKSKIILWLFNIIGILSLINVESRTAMISIFFYLICIYIIPKTILKKIAVIRIMYILIIIIGILIPYIYSSMYLNGIEFTVPFFNKSLYTGREELWIEVIEKMRENPMDYIIGLGNNESLSFSATVHSAFFRAFVRYGMIGFLGLYIFLIDKIEKIIRNDKNGDQLIYVIAWLAMMISGFFEVSYMMTTFAIPMSFLLGLGVSEIKKEEEKKNGKKSVTCG